MKIKSILFIVALAVNLDASRAQLNIGGLVNVITGGVSNITNQVVNTVNSTVNTAANATSNVVDGAAGIVGDVADAAADIISVVVNSTTNTINQTVDTVVDTADQVIGTATSLLNGTINRILSAFGEALDLKFETDLAEILDLTTLISELAESFTSILSEVLDPEVIANLVKKIVDAIEGILREKIEADINVMKNVTSLIPSITETVTEILTDALDSDGIGDLDEKIQNAAIALIKKKFETDVIIIKSLASLRTILTGKLTDILSDVLGSDGIGNLVEDVWSAIEDLVTTKLETDLNLINAMASFITELPETLIGILRDAISSKGIANLIQKLVNATVEVINAKFQADVIVLNIILASITQFTEKITAILNDALGSDGIGNLVQNLVDAIVGIINAKLQADTDLIEGIGTELTEKFTEILSALLGV